MKTTKHLIKELKQNSEDYEFYPTTLEIIEKLSNDLNLKVRDKYSLLDIGAGDGKVFRELDKLDKKNYENSKDIYGCNFYQGRGLNTKLAIEKSRILTSNYENDIIVIGSDFETNTLVDKKVDIIYSNPPYSKYEYWVEKILKEANCKYIYLVIPSRWCKNKYLEEILNKRNISYEIIGKYDFLESEDRKARANVDLIRFELVNSSDSFDLWFDEFFKINAKKSNYEYIKKNKKENINSLIKKESVVKELIKFYNTDLENLLNTYKSLEQLDCSIFKELDIDLNNLKEALKIKINGLKKVYWDILFDNLDEITNRLCKKSRDKIRSTLLRHITIDFEESNIYNILLWVIKNSNIYFEKQLKDFYLSLANKDSIKLYKSNKKTLEEDGWRYIKDKVTHYSLDYRVIVQFYRNIDSYSQGKLSDSSAYFLSDIITIASNLGFYVEKYTPEKWEHNVKYTWLYAKDNEVSTFVEFRLYKNGNIHFKFNQEFMKKLNIEAARLFGWIKEPDEAVEELDLTKDEAITFFGSLFKIRNNKIKLLSY